MQLSDWHLLDGGLPEGEAVDRGGAAEQARRALLLGGGAQPSSRLEGQLEAPLYHTWSHFWTQKARQQTQL